MPWEALARLEMLFDISGLSTLQYKIEAEREDLA